MGGPSLEPFESAVTDNALYRLGDDMVVRLPRIESATGQVDNEHQWLPRFAPMAGGIHNGRLLRGVF